MMNIIIVLKLWVICGKIKKVLLKTDNMAVVQIYTNEYTRDMNLATYVRNLWLIAAKYDIELVVIHIESKNNVIADVLSRWNNNYNVLEQNVKTPKWHSVSPQLFEMDYCI